MTAASDASTLPRVMATSQPGTVGRAGGAASAAPARPHAQHGVNAILAAITQLGTMQFAIALGTLVRNKLLAVHLKPEGFGEFSQILTIAAPVYVLAQCGMAVGLSRNTAAATTGPDRQRQLETANVVTAFIAAASLVAILPLIFSPAGGSLMSGLGVRDRIEQKIILAVLLSIAPLEALRNNYLSFLQGLLDIKGISAKRTVAVAAGTAAAFPLIACFGVAGACAQAVLASFLIALLLGLRCRALGFRPLAMAFHRPAARLLAAFGAASLVIAFTQNSVDALIRAHLIAFAGVSANGLYQAAFALSAQVTTVVLGSIGAYSLATLSQTASAAVLQSRLDDLLRVVLPVSALALGTAGLAAAPLFALLFSSQFAGGTRFLPLLLCGNYVQVASWATGAPLLGRGLIRYWIGVQMVSVGTRYAIAVAGTPVMGSYAVPAAFVASLTFDLAAYLVICSRMIGIAPTRRTLARFAAGGAAVAFAALAGSFGAGAHVIAAAAVALAAAALVMAWQDVPAVLAYGARVLRTVTSAR